MDGRFTSGTGAIKKVSDHCWSLIIARFTVIYSLKQEELLANLVHWPLTVTEKVLTTVTSE